MIGLQRASERSGPSSDVVFYMPPVGSLISSIRTLPSGGAETQILMLAKRLAAMGARVAIVAFGTPSELPAEVDGVAIVALPRRKRGGLIGRLSEPIRIWRALWRAPSRVIVGRGAGPPLGVIALYARLTSRRFVWSSTSTVDFYASKIIPRRLDLALHSLGVRLCDAIVVQTDEQVAMCRATYGRTPAAVIKSLSPLPEQRQRRPEAFLWVGRLSSYKRPLEYLALAHAVPEAKFWMIGVPTQHLEGDGLVAEEVVTRARSIANLELLQPRSHADLKELMWQAVACVNTSDFEGMPNVLLEGWSRGVPALVLTHDPGGVVVTHGLGGFADGSRERLVELARAQWHSRGDQAVASLRCREYIAAHHSPEVVSSQWCEVLALDLSRGGPTPARDTVATCAA